MGRRIAIGAMKESGFRARIRSMIENTPPVTRKKRSIYERQLAARRWFWSNWTDEAVLVYRRSAQGKDKARVRLVETFLFLREIAREFLTLQVSTRAASLAYTTLLSLIPLLVAFSFFLGRLFKRLFPNFRSQLDTFLNVILPYQSVEITNHLNKFIDSAGAASFLSVLVFFTVSFRLFMAVEATINHIWKVPSARTYRQKIRSFTMLFFWGPVLMTFSFTTSASLQANPVIGSIVTNNFVEAVFRTIAIFIAFTMLFWLVPSTKVNVRAAAVGGFVTALLFQLVRFGFGIYAQYLFTGRFNVIYGALGLLIIFLLALEAMWIVVLLGVQVSYVYQNLQGILRASEQQIKVNPAFNLYFAIRAMLEIARRFEAREEAPSSYRLAEDLEATDQQMLSILRTLEDAQLVKEIGGDWTGFVPGGDPDNITLEEIVRCMEGGRREIPPSEKEDQARNAVGGMFQNLVSCTHEGLGKTTIGRLVREVYGSAAPSRASDGLTTAPQS